MQSRDKSTCHQISLGSIIYGPERKKILICCGIELQVWTDLISLTPCRYRDIKKKSNWNTNPCEESHVKSLEHTSCTVPSLPCDICAPVYRWVACAALSQWWMTLNRTFDPKKGEGGTVGGAIKETIRWRHLGWKTGQIPDSKDMFSERSWGWAA